MPKRTTYGDTITTSMNKGLWQRKSWNIITSLIYPSYQFQRDLIFLLKHF